MRLLLRGRAALLLLLLGYHSSDALLTVPNASGVKRSLWDQEGFIDADGTPLACVEEAASWFRKIS